MYILAIDTVDFTIQIANQSADNTKALPEFEHKLQILEQLKIAVQ